MRENFIEVNNQLPNNVYCVPSFDYPDTALLFTNKEKILANDSIYYVGSFNSKRLFYIDLCKIETWKRLVKSDTIQIFVFDENTVKEKSWNEIVSGKLYLRRLIYTYNDIINNGCKITVK
jgi:hypothetical protein